MEDATHTTLGPDSTSPIFAVLCVGNNASSLLNTTVELGLTALATARNAST